jgi:hypothetical protein
MRGRAIVATQLRRLEAGLSELLAPARDRNALRRGIVVAGCIALTCLALPPRESNARVTLAVAAVQDTGEYDLKAQFLLRFATPYVKWPETAFESKTSPFLVGILGKDPFGKSLDELMKEKKVGEHPIKIVRFEDVDELETCHMLFVPGSQEKQLEKVAKFAKHKPMLIVAESITAAQSGAHIGFYLEKSRVRFAINPTAAKQAKLDVSSELLKLAKLVENKSERDL